MRHVEWRGVVYAAIYGAASVTVAYFVAHGSLAAFLIVMIVIGVAIRLWAVWFRVRRGIPLRRARHDTPRSP